MQTATNPACGPTCRQNNRQNSKPYRAGVRSERFKQRRSGAGMGLGWPNGREAGIESA